jgi:hypothetical protein
VQLHETGISFERGIFLGSPGSRCRPIHLVGNYELWFSIKGKGFTVSFGDAQSRKKGSAAEGLVTTLDEVR